MAVAAGSGPDLDTADPRLIVLRLGGQPGQRGGRVRPVGLGHPDRVVAEPLRLAGLQLLPAVVPAPK